MWVFIYTSLFALCSILYGKFLDYLATKYDRVFLEDGEEKYLGRLVFEICLQLGATSVGVYIFREFIRMDKFNHLKMPGRWTKILTKRKYLTASTHQIFHRMNNLFLFFSETKHDTAFHDQIFLSCCSPKCIKRPGILTLRTQPTL